MQARASATLHLSGTVHATFIHAYVHLSGVMHVASRMYPTVKLKLIILYYKYIIVSKVMGCDACVTYSMNIVQIHLTKILYVSWIVSEDGELSWDAIHISILLSLLSRHIFDNCTCTHSRMAVYLHVVKQPTPVV